eukprot:CAMPEP_0178415194 /NCGR_PEP_ID=MMETSP0689_2-20121128/23427_1 /TAXON_ID=160604 /ORGANISM="Amphidinium massartii, Strain CS-259" /LENGTH=35 /DNA_ID= /DNA_START= /DNA_END= /DNA_ORIENTATION=
MAEDEHQQQCQKAKCHHRDATSMNDEGCAVVRVPT